MKITRTQLQKIIKEELEQAIQEGEIDEAWPAGLFGGAKKIAKDVGSAVVGAGSAVKQYGKNVAAAGAKASKDADIAKLQSQLKQLNAQQTMLQQKLTTLQSTTADPTAAPTANPGDDDLEQANNMIPESQSSKRKFTR